MRCSNRTINFVQALKLLLKCRLVEPNLVNIDDLTFVDILRTQGENAGGGNLDLEQAVIKTGCVEAASMPKFKEESDLLKSPINFMTYYSTSMKRMKILSVQPDM